MIKNPQRQKRNAFVAVAIIVFIVLLGALGYVAWNNFFAPKGEAVNVTKSTNAASEEETEYKIIKINNHEFRYPVNKNNEQVIIIPGEAMSALQVSYVPIRNYYADKSLGDDCKSYIAGLVNVNTEKEIMDYSYLTRFYGKETLQDALVDGTVVRIGSEDLYLSGPFKQNEICTDINESKDPELQNILLDVKTIRLVWLKSLELVK